MKRLLWLLCILAATILLFGVFGANGKPLVTYFAYSFYLFFAIGILIYRYTANQGGHVDKRLSVQYLKLLFLAAFIFRIGAALLVEGFSVDINLFRFWAENAARDLTGIYHGGFFIDYPPFYVYFLYLIGKTAEILGISTQSPLYILLLKMPSMAADMVTAYLLYRMAKDRLPDGWRLFIAGIYLFNPAVLINSALWGQVDSFLTLLLALGFLQLANGKPSSGIAFAAAVLTKPQGLIFMPVVLFELLKRRDAKLLLKTLLFGVGAGLLIILPFAVTQEPLWIVNLFFATAEGYKYVSLNAFNFFALMGANLKLDELTWFVFRYRTWGFIFIFLVTGYTGLLYLKGKESHLPYLGAAVMAVGIFMMSIRMHERYLFPALFFFLVMLIVTRDKRSLLFYGVFSVTVFINTYVVLLRMIVDDYPHVPPNNSLLLLISMINVAGFICLMVWAWRLAVKGTIGTLIPIEAMHGSRRQGVSMRRTGNRTSGRSRLAQQLYPKLCLTRNDYGIMLAMTLIYLVIALVNLGNMEIPATSWRSQNRGEGVIVDLGAAQELSRLTYFVGLGKGTYQLSWLDQEGNYQEVAEMEAEDKDFYKWRVAELPVITRYLRIEARKPGGELIELAVFGADRESPLSLQLLDLSYQPVLDGELINLIDEQHIAAYRPSYLNSTYFDEIYHARTAYEHLNRIKPYEWTHPPLGKILISGGIALFGMNPFGWRIVGTLFGAAMIPLMYLFGKKLFQTPLLGFCAAFLMMFDLMHFAQTRIATIDVYTTFFVILMYYYMADYYLQKSYEKSLYSSLRPLFLSGLFFGLGVATKWSVLYGAPGLAFLFLLAKYNEYQDYRREILRSRGDQSSWTNLFWPLYVWRTILYCILFFIVIPGAVYLLSYIPYLLVPGMHVSDIFKYQQSMYNYHSKLEATHSFASAWWSWPLMIRPIWYYRGLDLPAGQVSTIASFGNPAIWWPGILAVLAAFKGAWKGNKAMILVVVGIAAQYLPWIPVPRIAFIYHFFPILPFVMLCIVYCIKILLEKGLTKGKLYGYLLITGLLFFLFYPAISGMIVSEAYINGLRWLNTWVF